MFLSATPSKEAYALCHGKAVANLSKRRKEALGISKPAISKAIKATPVTMPGRTLLKKLTLMFVDVIEEHKISAAHTYVHQSEMAVNFRKKSDPFYVKSEPGAQAFDEKELRRFVRWNVHCPVGDKALILTSKHDPLVNINTLLRSTHDQYNKHYVYKRGNRVPRKHVYDFFQLGENLDLENVDDCIAYKNEFRRQAFRTHIMKHYPNVARDDVDQFIDNQVDFSESSDYLNYRVYHGLIENTLEYLTGFDSARLDYERFHDLEGLVKLVKNRSMGFKSAQALEQRLLNDNIPRPVSTDVASAMLQVIQLFVNADEDGKSSIADNWPLDKGIHQRLNKNPIVSSLADKFKTMFLMTGLGKTATPATDNKPFYGLDEAVYTLKDYAPAKEAPLKHKLSTLEALDDSTEQVVFSPNYCNLTPEVTDNLFRKGLIGAYITSERATGFNDPNLHHVAMLLDKHDVLNRPDQIIQGAGRNRGLNPAQQPSFFLVQDEGVSMTFSPDLLDRGDYFPDLFKSRARTHQAVVHCLGEKIADEIQSWIETALDPYGRLDPVALQAKCRDIFLDEFDRIYQENGHDFRASKLEFCHVLNDTYAALHRAEKKLNESYTIPFIANVIGSILYVVSQVWYYLKTSSTRRGFIQLAHDLAEKNADEIQPELTYAHIIKQYNFRNMTKNGIALKRLLSVMNDDSSKAEHYLSEKPTKFLKEETLYALNEYFKKEMAPQLVKFLGTINQQVELLTLIGHKNNWVGLLYKHREQLASGIGPAEQGMIFYQIIQEDARIKKYIDKHQIEYSTVHIEKARDFSSHIKTELMSCVVLGMAQGILPVDTVNEYIKNNLDHFVLMLDPRHALVFLRHKNKLHFSQENIQSLQQTDLSNPDAAFVLDLFTEALPSKYRGELEDIPVDDHHDAKQMLNELAVDNASVEHLDPAKLRKLWSQTLARFVEDKMYRSIINEIVAPLSEVHLETILTALYPNDTDNARKLELILEFMGMINGNYTSQQLFRKYCPFENDDLIGSDFIKIQTWLSDIHQEIVDSHCHYQCMSRKGESWPHFEVEPKLKNGRQPHVLWDMRDTDDVTGMIGLARKSQFLMATIDAFDPLNKIDGLKDQHLQKSMRDAAQFVVAETRAAIKNPRHQPSFVKLKRDQVESIHLSGQFGRFFSSANSLTPEEIKSRRTIKTSAVEKIREQVNHSGFKV